MNKNTPKSTHPVMFSCTFSGLLISAALGTVFYTSGCKTESPLTPNTSKDSTSVITPNDTLLIQDTIISPFIDTVRSPVQKVLIDMYVKIGLLPNPEQKSYTLKKGEIERISYFNESSKEYVAKVFNSELSDEGILVYDVQEIDSYGVTQYSRDTITKTDDGLLIRRAYTRQGKPPEEATSWHPTTKFEWVYYDGGITVNGIGNNGEKEFLVKYVANGNDLRVLGDYGETINTLSNYTIELK